MFQRLIAATGDARERGRCIGRATAGQIRRVFDEFDRRAAGAGRPTFRQHIPAAQSLLPFIAEHAPRTLEEMTGLSEGSGVDFDALLVNITGYDRFMGLGQPAQTTEKCTAFAAIGDATADGRLVCGQNNDEGLEGWLDGEADVVLHHVEPDGLQTLAYTHVGIPAYMGMNSAGLCVLWMYINNGDVGPGVPTVVLLRELLRKTSLDEAVDWLRATPRTCPNNFILAHARDGIASVEMSHRWFHEHRTGVALCHANHILEPKMFEQDRFRDQPTNTSFSRQRRMGELLRENHGRINPAIGQRFLRDRALGPQSILSQPEDRWGWQTLASMVFHPAAGEMFITAGWADDARYVRYAFHDGVTAPACPVPSHAVGR